MIMTIVTILNVGFLGEQQQLRPISEMLGSKYAESQVKQAAYEDNASDLVKKLDEVFKVGEKNILLVSGQKGSDLIKKADIRTIIQNKRVFVLWVGHQSVPGLIENIQWLRQEKLPHKIALPNYIIKTYPALAEFESSLIKMEAVPNNIKESDLQTALTAWNKKHADQPIEIRPDDRRIPVGIFLGGDAPKPDGSYLYWGEKEACEIGEAFAAMALREKKFLWVTNSPRTGKFYPESSNPKKPVIRQFKAGQWLSFSALTKDRSEAAILIEQEAPENQGVLAHAPGSPLDPKSQAFIEGLKKGGLKEIEDFCFLDFKVGNSAMNAILGLLKQNSASEIYYSAESISNAALGYLFPNCYGFCIESMSLEHRNAFTCFQELGLVADFDLTTSKKGAIDVIKKQALIKEGSQDVPNIIKAVSTAILESSGQKPISSGPASMLHSPAGVAAATATIPAAAPDAAAAAGVKPKPQ